MVMCTVTTLTFLCKSKGAEDLFLKSTTLLKNGTIQYPQVEMIIILLIILFYQANAQKRTKIQLQPSN